LDERRFPKAIETAAFRIIQEALTNVIRYAKTSDAQVRIDTQDDHLRVKIQDRGQGFDVDQHIKEAYQSGGLSGMRERAAWLGGSVEIHSRQGEGTTVLASFDLKGSDQHD
jgi:signal transduction histidine kinase